jgi:hypothetical protein
MNDETATEEPFTPIERAFIEAMVAAITRKLRARYAQEAAAPPGSTLERTAHDER